MEFLEKLYSNENFGIYLFAVIAILIILFFVVLFFGKKDQVKTQKTSKEELPKEPEEKKEEEPVKLAEEQPKEPEAIPTPISPMPFEENLPVSPTNVIDGFKEVTEETPLNSPIPSEPTPIPEPKEPEMPQRTSFPNVVLNSNLTESEELPKEPEEKKEEEPDIPEKEFDFDALAAAISKELDSLNVEKTIEETPNLPTPEAPKPVIEEKPVIPTFEPVLPDKQDEKKDLPKEETPIIKQKPVMPTVFSSVYVNRADELKQPEKEEPVPVKPQFELPKMVDLPKKAEPIEKVEPKETFTVNTILNNLEDETYPVDKN